MQASTPTLSTEQRTADWQHHVDACEQSGLSKAQYCRNHDLAYHLFIYWSTKLGGAVPDTAASPKASTGKLVPVTLATNNAYPFSPHGLQVHFPNGVRVSGIDSDCIGLLGQLIEQL